MSKVFVDRELLLQLFRCWDCGLEVDNELAQLRIAAAQPAEAEGVEVVAWRTPSGSLYDSKEVAEKNIVTGHICKTEPLVLQSNHLAALSAVTAERDRLADMLSGEVEANIKLREQWNQLSEEVEALRAENERLSQQLAQSDAALRESRANDMENVRTLENMWERHDALRQELEALRKDAERYRWASSGVHEAETLVSIVNCHGGYAEKVAERVDVYRDAAMAAKEA
jgi:prefoldin subunit 5